MRRIGMPLVLGLLLAVVLPARADATIVGTTYTVGAQPFGITTDPTDGKVYVANSGWLDPSGKGMVSVIDPSTGTVDRLTTSGKSNFVAVDGGARRLYSSNDNGTLDVVDLTTMSLVTTLPVGGLTVVADPVAHRVYVVNSRHLYAVDGNTNTVVATVSAPYNEGWFGLALDPAFHRIYITDSYPYSAAAPGPGVDVLDDRDLSFVTKLALPVIPRYAIAVDDVRHRMIVGGPLPYDGQPYFSSELFAYDSATLEPLYDSGRLERSNPAGLVFDRTHDRFFATDFVPAYRVLDAETFGMTESGLLPWTPGLATVARDGRTYVCEYADPLLPYGPAHVAVLEFGNHPPVIRATWFTPAAPTTSDLLTAWADAYDPDFPTSPHPTPTFTYAWSVNGILLADATQQTLDLSVPGHGERGDTVSAVITATDGELSVARSMSVVVANAVPLLGVTLNTTSPLTNDVLSAAVTASDPDGDTVALSYQWLRNGAVISGANGPTLDLGTYGDHDDVLTVDVAAADGHGGIAHATASATVADTPPTVTVSLNDTTPYTNDVLVATASGADADGDVMVYGFMFRVNGVATQFVGYSTDPVARFDLGLPGHGDRGDVITVDVAALAKNVASPVATAAATVVNSPPVLAVSLSNTSPTRREVLVATATASDADGDSGFVYTYSWTVGSKVRQQTTTTATTSSFDLSGYNVGDVVKLAVVATDGLDRSAPALTSATISPR